MMEDIRNHDASPTQDEREWMALDAVEIVLKSLALAVIALTIGITASVMLDQAGGTSEVSIASAR